MGIFCDHQWECDPQGHHDGYRRSVQCSKCDSLNRTSEGPCAADCQAVYKPGAIYFMGLVPEFEDDEWDHDKHCSCEAAPAIRITTRMGEVPTAECPACHQEYTVLVAGKGREGCYPVHPGQII